MQACCSRRRDPRQKSQKVRHSGHSFAYPDHACALSGGSVRQPRGGNAKASPGMAGYDFIASVTRSAACACQYLRPPVASYGCQALGIPKIWAVMETITESEHTSHAASFIHQHADWIIGISSTTLRPFHNAGLDGKTTILFPSWNMEDYQPEAGWRTGQASAQSWGFMTGNG